MYEIGIVKLPEDSHRTQLQMPHVDLGIRYQNGFYWIGRVRRSWNILVLGMERNHFD